MSSTYGPIPTVSAIPGTSRQAMKIPALRAWPPSSAPEFEPSANRECPAAADTANRTVASITAM